MKPSEYPFVVIDRSLPTLNALRFSVLPRAPDVPLPLRFSMPVPVS